MLMDLGYIDQEHDVPRLLYDPVLLFQLLELTRHTNQIMLLTIEVPGAQADLVLKNIDFGSIY
jgi:hypothetical protein